MNRLADIESILPEMKSGDGLIKALEIKPDYNESIREENMAVRLMGVIRYLQCIYTFEDDRGNIISCISH